MVYANNPLLSVTVLFCSTVVCVCVRGSYSLMMYDVRLVRLTGCVAMCVLNYNSVCHQICLLFRVVCEFDLGSAGTVSNSTIWWMRVSHNQCFG